MHFGVLSTNDPADFPSLYSADINIIIVDIFMSGLDTEGFFRTLYHSRSKASLLIKTDIDHPERQALQQIAQKYDIPILDFFHAPVQMANIQKILADYIHHSGIQHHDEIHMPSFADLKRALAQDEMSVAYQPQINLSTGAISGVEALIRWTHPTMGEIPADYFIPLAEKSRLIDDFTSFAARTAIQQAGLWRSHGLNLRMSINFSPHMLDDPNLPEKLSLCANDFGADISNIILEITENTLMSDVPSFMEILARLRTSGFKLALDDFGTGYSSLKLLVRAPFSKMKIDKIFVQNLDTDKECLSIVEISVLLAHKLGMTVIAEGIENEKVWNILREMGCDEGQGYWMAKAMRPEKIEPWITKWSSS